MRFNLSLKHQFSKKWIAELGYIDQLNPNQPMVKLERKPNVFINIQYKL
jgi:hypothetical protein